MQNQVKYTLTNALGIFFIAVYAFVSFAPFGNFDSEQKHGHQHLHEISLEEHILISSACHNTIYHNTTADCGHEEHFSEPDKKCFTCKISLTKKATLPGSLQNIFISKFKYKGQSSH